MLNLSYLSIEDMESNIKYSFIENIYNWIFKFLAVLKRETKKKKLFSGFLYCKQNSLYDHILFQHRIVDNYSLYWNFKINYTSLIDILRFWLIFILLLKWNNKKIWKNHCWKGSIVLWFSVLFTYQHNGFSFLT